MVITTSPLLGSVQPRERKGSSILPPRQLQPDKHQLLFFPEKLVALPGCCQPLIPSLPLFWEGVSWGPRCGSCALMGWSTSDAGGDHRQLEKAQSLSYHPARAGTQGHGVGLEGAGQLRPGGEQPRHIYLHRSFHLKRGRITTKSYFSHEPPPTVLCSEVNCK